MSETSNREDRQDHGVFALHHPIQRTIAYQLSALYPPIHEAWPEASAKLAELTNSSDERVLPTNDSALSARAEAMRHQWREN